MKTTWLVASVVLAATLVSTSRGAADQPQRSSKPAGSTLRIVKDDLVEAEESAYIVKGSIYNPNSEAVKNVVIKYYIWKKWMGKDIQGSIIKETGGLVFAVIKYLPPKQIVEFTAVGNPKAGRMSKASGLLPDPIEAEITAEWDDQ